MSSRADDFLEGFKLGSMGIKSHRPVSIPKSKISSEDLRVKLFKVDTNPRKPYVYLTASWEEGLRREYMFDLPEAELGTPIYAEILLVGNSSSTKFWIELMILYNYNTQTDIFDDEKHFLYKKMFRNREESNEIVSKLSKQAKMSGLLGAQFPDGWRDASE